MSTDLFGGTLQTMIDRAIALLKTHEPAEGYYLAFSGGKDSCIIAELCVMAGVKHQKWHNNTTIDAPELIQFIKKFHPDAKWNNPKINMMTRVATAAKVPPTRAGRWCCEEYKENGGIGHVRVIGVRAAESPGRAGNWSEYAQDQNEEWCVCPIVFWSDAEVWEFIRAYDVPYCKLYDEGFTRLGCVGCPLASRENIDKEFARWPNYERNWKKAVIANWEKWHDKPRRDGKPRYHAKFASGEEFWQWWRNYKSPPDLMREECQSGILFTNHENAMTE